jgi:HAD superfamily hydrolase (TIGR01509 family)
MNWTAPPGTTALIFDCDGTLADTMPGHFRAWTAVLGRYGIPFPESRFYQVGGVPSARFIRLLAEESGVVVTDVDLMVQEKEGAFLLHLESVQPLAPVVRVAGAYLGKLPMAVASGGYREVVGQTLDRLGIRGWFDTVVCAEDTARHKPEPDVFLEAAKRLGVEPAGCAVFEDTDIGLEAASRAGMRGVDVRPRLVARD